MKKHKYFGKRAYVAIPSSHPDKAAMDLRMRQVGSCMALLQYNGYFTLTSSIYDYTFKHTTIFQSDTSPMYTYDKKHWSHMEDLLISWSDFMVVVALPCWSEASDMIKRIDISRKHRKPVYCIQPEAIDTWNGSTALEVDKLFIEYMRF